MQGGANLAGNPGSYAETDTYDQKWSKAPAGVVKTKIPYAIRNIIIVRRKHAHMSTSLEGLRNYLVLE